MYRIEDKRGTKMRGYVNEATSNPCVGCRNALGPRKAVSICTTFNLCNHSYLLLSSAAFPKITVVPSARTTQNNRAKQRDRMDTAGVDRRPLRRPIGRVFLEVRKREKSEWLSGCWCYRQTEVESSTQTDGLPAQTRTVPILERFSDAP